MKTVGYAIVGTGYFGAELGRIMKEQEGAKIVAVLDPENGQTIADELGCDWIITRSSSLMCGRRRKADFILRKMLGFLLGIMVENNKNVVYNKINVCINKCAF